MLTRQTPSVAGMRSARRVSAGLMMLGGLFYSVWLLELLLPTKLSPRTSYVSELGANGEPHALLFRMGDTLAGVSMTVAGLVALLLLRRSPSWRHERWAFRLLALFGLATVADSLCPMSCVATRDAECAAREASWQVPWTHLAHTGTSTVAVTALGVAFAVLLWRRQRVRCWIGWEGRMVLGALFVLWLGLLVATLAAHLPGVRMDTMGLVQRGQLLLTTALLMVLAWRWWGSQPQEATVVADQRVGQQPGQ